MKPPNFTTFYIFQSVLARFEARSRAPETTWQTTTMMNLWLFSPASDGTDATFQVWWMRFTAFAIVHRFKAAINPKGAEEDLPTTEATVIPAGTDGAPDSAAVRRNSVAYANLSLALNSEQLVRILVAGQTTAWPSGLAWRVVQALHR